MLSLWRLLLALGVVMATALPVEVQSVPGSDESSPPTDETSPPDEELNLSAFVGDWSHHGFLIRIADDGSAAALWRVYQWCGQGVPTPCDRIENTGIIAGGRGELTVTPVAPDMVQGEVVSSTDEVGLPEGPFTLQLMPYGMAVLQQDGQEDLVLCGPRYLDDAPQDLIDHTPCGA